MNLKKEESSPFIFDPLKRYSTKNGTIENA